MVWVRIVSTVGIERIKTITRRAYFFGDRCYVIDQRQKLGNVLPICTGEASVKHWTLTTLRDKLIKIGCKVVHHARRVVFQLAEVAIPRSLFALILLRIERLRLLVPEPP